jgi:hypothetical protein
LNYCQKAAHIPNGSINVRKSERKIQGELMSTVVSTSNSQSDAVSLVARNTEFNSNSENSAGKRNPQGQKTSPFSSDGTMGAGEIPIVLTSSGQANSLKIVSLAAAPDSDSSPTAPIQPIIDLLFKSEFMNEINQGFMQGLKGKDKGFESIDVIKNPGITPLNRN